MTESADGFTGNTHSKYSEMVKERKCIAISADNNAAERRKGGFTYLAHKGRLCL